jgi:uncharacterized protein (TIGR02301 family)
MGALMKRLSRIILVLALAGLAGPAAAQDLFRSILGPPRPYYPPPPRGYYAPPPQYYQQPRLVPAPAPTAPRVAPQPKDAAKEPPKIPETPPVYDGEMSRLAEILGALHYLRPLCGTKDGSRWRNEMSGMIDAESPPPERRDRLIANFNRSYVAYEQTYRTCTPAADLAIRRFLDEGARLSREIATRYGN